MTEKKKVSIVGSGNWGSAIARIVGKNAARLSTVFDPKVRMWVFEEVLNDGRKLSEVINTDHENVKYLPGYKLPSNVVAVTDLLEATLDADVLVFVIPHQFLKKTCAPLVGKLKPNAVAMSLVKGFELLPEGGIALISKTLSELLSVEVGVLMGANLAPEVAAEKFCETTIGCRDTSKALLLKQLFQTEFFRVTVTSDASTVEICGALKNIVAVGAGISDGLGHGDNTKAAVIRLGLMEMIRFGEHFYPGGRLATYFESCGVADLVTTCYGGRNRRVAEAFVKTGKPIPVLEQEMLNGQRLQGPETAREVYVMLEKAQQLDKFPLFVAIHKICEGSLKPDQMIDCIRQHPEHLMLDPERTLLPTHNDTSALEDRLELMIKTVTGK